MSMTPVGSTARWVAANRALEQELSNPLFTDPFARELAGADGFAMMASMRAAITGATFSGPDPYLTIRTRFFDEAMLDAVRNAGITQALIVAAGMDARAFRLEWPQDLVLFEVDREDVFAQKEPVLTRLGATPRCDRRLVPADLTGAWDGALTDAGFDAARPAAILVEGLVYYLGEAATRELLQRLDTLASEGSWIGIDFVNKDMLTSPYFASYLARLRELGCPWIDGVNDPEALLARYGWQATAVTPGESGANFDRWPYPIIPRSVPNMPRIYLAQGRKVASGTVVVPTAPASATAAAPAPIRYEPVLETDLCGSFGCLDTQDLAPGVLALGGSDGGLPEYFLDLLVPEGFACLALGYFGMEGTQPSLLDVPLERIERGLRWLAAHPRVKTHEGRVAVVGASRGGELALLVASTFPDLVGPVVAYTPSAVVWPGIDAEMRPGPLRSSWSLGGRPLPCVTYVEGVMPTMSERGMSVRTMCERALDNTAAVEQAAIAVERAAGPLLLVSGSDDQVWPAERMCRMVVDRLTVHGRAADVTHLNYLEAGHGLFPYTGPSGASPRPRMRLDLGGTAAANQAAHADAWSRVVAHLRGAIASA